MRNLLSFFILLIAIPSNAQNVGIGTTTPLDKLTVQSVPNSYGITHTDGTIKLSTFLGGSTGGGWIGTQSNHPLSFFTNNSSSQMILLQNGKFGIGTITPGFKLDIKSNLVESNNNTNLLNLSGRNPVVLLSDENNIGYGYIKSWTNAPNPGYSTGLELGAVPGQSIYFSTNYSPTMVIDNFNKVGIGTSTPASKLEVKGGPDFGNTEHSFRLAGNNVFMDFTDNSGVGYGFFRNRNNNTTGGFDVGLEIGVLPPAGGNPDRSIMFSTYYGPRMVIKPNGFVGINTMNPTMALSVNGNIRSKEVVVETGWADYVFSEEYRLLPLEEVKQFIDQYKHLPNIPSAKEIEKNGLYVGDIQKRMMEKIEELTLYVIELKKEIETLKKNNQ